MEHFTLSVTDLYRSRHLNAPVICYYYTILKPYKMHIISTLVQITYVYFAYKTTNWEITVLQQTAALSKIYNY